MKKCSKCLVEKEISLFSKNRKNSDGLSNQCKECKKKASKIYRDNNKEKIRERNKKFNDNNKEYFREYAIKNKDLLKEYKEEYIQKNKEVILDKRRRYSKLNRVKNKEYLRKYRSKNKEKFNKYYENSKETKKIYYEKNKEIIKKKRNEYFKKRKSVDNLFKLSCNIRTLISLAVNRKYAKYSKTIEILGCSFEELKIHLEKNFQDWMSWDNYGLYNGELNYGWDIDHIIPLKTATTEDAIIQLNHFSNLQPLCSKVNRDIKKGSPFF